MIDASTFERLIFLLGDVAKEDIEWAENCKPPEHAQEFALEAIFVICCSGMKYTVARGIYARVRVAINEGQPVAEVFHHPGKAAAIETIWKRREEYFREYLSATDKVEYCGALPFIGKITRYHLAKSFGVQVAKPDVHLQRLADREGVTVKAMCERLAAATEYSVPVVDIILWRACEQGVLDSRTGDISE